MDTKEHELLMVIPRVILIPRPREKDPAEYTPSVMPLDSSPAMAGSE